MSEKFPRITVIILHYNEFALTKKCIQSVVKTRYPHFDILVVDNASTNDSSDKLKEYCTNKQISYIRSEKNLFYTGGFNLGAKHAKGEYIIFLNNDTEVDPDWISELIQCCEGNNKVFIQPQILFSDKRTVVDNRGGKYRWWGSGYGIGRNKPMMRVTSKTVDYTVGTACMIKRSFFLKLGGFDEWYRGYYEDVDLSLRVKRNGGTCMVCYSSLVYHKGSSTYKKHVLKSDHLFDIRKNRLRTVLKNFSGIERILRITIALISYAILLMVDPGHASVTIRAVYFAFRPEELK
ncbi:glycosyltransferase family 2 protein [Candidatus Roizmanbacteria bacterium]|nr:MAG: glycosyltransferase family 2 protein [Candidatus Roizmanbacteria bacterium]